jgi:hypothetical protein
MQIRPKTYLHFISLWRSLRDAIPPRHRGVSDEASPFLIYTAVMLLFLLLVLEVDAHRSELASLGFFSHDHSIPGPFLGP